MQSPKRCRGSMPQSNDRPHLPLTWTRFDYLSVPVPSLKGDLTATALPPPPDGTAEGDAPGGRTRGGRTCRGPAPDGTAEGDAPPVSEGRRDAAPRRAAA